MARGAQDLSAFGYTPASLNYNAAAPILTPPTVLEDATLSYDAATTPDVCTVDANGALAILAVGTCTVTVTAAATANYTADETTAMVTVNPAGTLMLAVHDVTGDNIINSTEQADGFSIEGHTGTEAGVTVTVTLGGHSFAAVDLGACRGRDRRRLVGGRGAECGVYYRRVPDPHGGRGQDRLHVPVGLHQHLDGGPHGPHRAELRGPDRAHGGRGHHAPDPRGRDRHRHQ